MTGRSAIVLVIGLVISTATGAGEALAAPDDGNKPTPAPAREKAYYRDYLREIGDKLDCYFTVEEKYRQGMGFGDHDIVPGDDATIDAVVAKLNREFKGFRAVRDRANPSVVHLISTAPPEAEDYVMERRLSKKFRGRLDGLILELNDTYPAFGIKHGGLLGEEPGYPFTNVDLDVKDVTLRQLLTSAVPLAGYNRILWETYTVPEEGQLYTGIKFLGPKDRDTWFKDFDASKPPRFTRKQWYFLYLKEVGERLGCYFTIEENHDRPLKNSEFFILPGNDATIDEVIAKLNKEVKRYKAVRDDANPSVIHLINVSLTEAGLNVLDRKVTLAYEGTIEGLLDRLNQINPAIGNDIPVDNEGEGVSVKDAWEKVRAMNVAVDARDLPIRQVLTSAVDLPGYCPVIWTAHTKLERGKLFTEITFSGPKSPKK